MSGRRKGPSAAFMRGGLRLASWTYGIAVWLRNRRYDRQPARAQRCGVPVISVGNLTTGGTGKTPVVRTLASRLRRRGVRVVVVSRGYGRGEAEANDEALELHACLPEVPHVQDPDRVKAAHIAAEELNAELVLMDDGFQHRRLHRDLDLVVIDASCPFGYDYLLPRGLLREPIAALRRADLVILSRVGSVSAREIDNIRRRITRVAPKLSCVLSDHVPAGLLRHPKERLPIESLRGRSVAVLSAIGNPDAFADTVQGCGAIIAARRDLPDHDSFAASTVAEIDRWVRSLGDAVDQVLCTHKDLVKLQTDQIGDRPLTALLIELTILEGDDQLNTALEAVSTQ